MSTAEVVQAVTLAEWDREWAHNDSFREVVGGVPQVAPGEHAPNIRAAMRLLRIVETALSDVEGLPNIEVLIRHDPLPTVRRPDLVFVNSQPPVTGYRLEPHEVLAVVEVLSPGTARVDHVDKVTEYALAGIAAYLIIDVSRRDAPRLTLHTVPVDGRYESKLEATEVTLPLGAGVRLRADDLVVRIKA